VKLAIARKISIHVCLNNKRQDRKKEGKERKKKGGSPLTSPDRARVAAHRCVGKVEQAKPIDAIARRGFESKAKQRRGEKKGKGRDGHRHLFFLLLSEIAGHKSETTF